MGLATITFLMVFSLKDEFSNAFLVLNESLWWEFMCSKEILYGRENYPFFHGVAFIGKNVTA